MMPDATLLPSTCRAHVTTWPNLHDVADGNEIDTTWEEWFKTFEAPTRFAGDMTQPGWSAAIFEPRARAASNVVAMSALVLDYDAGTSIAAALDVWGDHYGAIYTTRKHKPDAPRFRVVLPFTRTVAPADYPIVWKWAQKIASGAGQKIDPSCKDVGRFWYRPGLTDHYEAHRLNGTPIDPETIVAAHKYAENERQRGERERTQPTGDVERRASKYLAKLPASISGSRGHQALWTASLALVRGFKLAPERAMSLLRSDFNPRCQPPWSEKELRHKVHDAENDAETPFGYLVDRVREVPRAPQPSPPPDDDFVPEVPGDLVDVPETSGGPRVASASNWRALLNTTNQGHVRNTFDNICRILENHEAYGEKLTYDEMRLTPMLGDKYMNDADVGRVRREIEQHFGFQPVEGNVRAAIGVVSDARRFHPVRRYLKSLEWDRVERINRIVPDVLHAANTPLHQSMVRKWFIAAAARAMRPGCKVDTILVLQGDQGWRKSSFFEVLGGEWFSDTYLDITDKDGFLQLHSAWIYEWGEIEGVTTAKQAAYVKGFASSRSDNFRAPFGRTTEPHPRTTVIVGSTNADQFLFDPTGSRRFNVARVTMRIDHATLATWRDQLWAEAVALLETGEKWWLDDEEEKARAELNAEFEIEDAWEPLVSDWLGTERPPGEALTTAKILTDACGLSKHMVNRAVENRIGGIMKRLGFERGRVRPGGTGKPTRVWTSTKKEEGT
jgi:hypothetical protein